MLVTTSHEQNPEHTGPAWFPVLINKPATLFLSMEPTVLDYLLMTRWIGSLTAPFGSDDPIE
ncbi:MAG: hypothetical protein CMJ81_15685 [Planctomycetaceae bacterium]|nr:hypothetical protein [Planctomycetaceae bacterium]